MKRLWIFLGLTVLGFTGCHRNMYDEPKFLPDQKNTYFPNEEVDRQPVEHTVPRGPVNDGTVFYTGKNGNSLATDFPVPVTDELVAQGREQFDINCSACHGRDGYGEGMVVQRGFPKPLTFHSDRLRNAPIGYYFGVITNGYGVMYPFGNRVFPSDRWAIISYIRALQFSQNANESQLPAVDRDQLGKTK